MGPPLELPLVVQIVKNLPAMQETWVPSLENSMDRGACLRSMAGCSPWGHKELDTTELVTQPERPERNAALVTPRPQPCVRFLTSGTMR